MKRVTIYGLPRTGTNYLEFLMRNNIECLYENRYLDKNESYTVTHTDIALKHCRPKKEYSDYHIFILKKFKNFLPSFLNRDIRGENDPYDVYNKAINDYLTFFMDNIDESIIVYHEDLLENESEFLWYTSTKFGLPIKHSYYDIITTDKRLNTSGGNGTLSEKYGGIPNNKEVDTTKIDDTIFRIDDVCWKKSDNDDFINVWNKT